MNRYPFKQDGMLVVGGVKLAVDEYMGSLPRAERMGSLYAEHGMYSGRFNVRVDNEASVVFGRLPTDPDTGLIFQDVDGTELVLSYTLDTDRRARTRISRILDNVISATGRIGVPDQTDYLNAHLSQVLDIMRRVPSTV